MEYSGQAMAAIHRAKGKARRAYPRVKGPMKITHADGTVEYRRNPSHKEVQRTIAKGARKAR